MSDHVRYQVAPPQVEARQKCASRERNENIRNTSRPMAKRKNDKWNYDGPEASQTNQAQVFDGVTTIKQFFHDSGPNNDQRN
jgi:hypothetical protein